MRSPHRQLSSVLSAILILISLNVQAEPSPTSASHDPTFLNMFTNIPDDLKDWWGITFSRENAPALAGTLGLTAAMIPTDYATWMAVYRPTQDNPSLYNFFKGAELWSSGLFQVTSSAIFLAWGATGNTRAMRTAWEIGESVLSSGVVVQLMKRATGRESPRSSLTRGGKWSSYPGEKPYTSSLRDYDAMPSGHMSSAFVIFQVIERNYPDQPWISYVGYPVMGIFALGCVGNNIHWFSDFPIAFALGYSFSKVVAYRYHPELKVADERNHPYRPNFTLGFSELSEEPLLMAHWRW
jgi:hypothetical protein